MPQKVNVLANWMHMNCYIVNVQFMKLIVPESITGICHRKLGRLFLSCFNFVFIFANILPFMYRFSIMHNPFCRHYQGIPVITNYLLHAFNPLHIEVIYSFPSCYTI